MDPMFGILMQQSQQQDIEAIQQKLQGDTASTLARYGARQMMAQAGAISPGAMATSALNQKLV